jgi:hypothetical protein
MTTTRLSPLDSAFFHLEDSHTSLHIASLAVFLDVLQDGVRAGFEKLLAAAGEQP